jgi:hypothetical protein
LTEECAISGESFVGNGELHDRASVGSLTLQVCGRSFVGVNDALVRGEESLLGSMKAIHRIDRDLATIV